MNDTNLQDHVLDSTNNDYVCEALPSFAERYEQASAAAEHLARHLHGRRVSPQLWRARCPNHAGSHRRMYIAANLDGTVGTICRSCGEVTRFLPSALPATLPATEVVVPLARLVRLAKG